MSNFSLFTQPSTQNNDIFLASIDISSFFQMVMTAACSLLHEYTDEEGFGKVPTNSVVKKEEAAVDYILRLANGKHRADVVEHNTRHMRLELIDEYVKYTYARGTRFHFLEPHQLPILVYYALLKNHNRKVQAILAEHKAMKNKQFGSAMKYQRESIFTMVEHWPRIYEFNRGVALPLPKDMPGYLEAPFPEEDQSTKKD